MIHPDAQAVRGRCQGLLLQRCQDRRQAGRDREPREVREGQD
jgi:hypothetical protein